MKKASSDSRAKHEAKERSMKQTLEEFLQTLSESSETAIEKLTQIIVHIRPSAVLRAGAPAPTRPRGLASPA